MSRWEYLVRVFALDKEDEVVINYVQREYPDRDWKEMPKYDPLTLEAWLSECGREGWELVSLEPAEKQGKQGDIGRGYTQGAHNWAQYFLCVFKRQVEE
ncbi:MAG: hypothetical protein KJ046_12705 [Anaerolineae bacterium]|nr:hypothetical protein [Anaerolineae bacterium]